MSENINLNINVNGQKEAENAAKGVENIGKSANKTKNFMTELRKELRDARSAMLQAEEGSNAYNAALAKVADIQFRIKDTGEKARLSVMDLGAVSQNVGRALAGVAGGFQTVAGAMTLFGIEGEASLKTIQNLTSLISVVQGLTAFTDTLDSLRDLFVGMKASAAAAEGAAQNFGNSMDKVSPQIVNATTNLAGMDSAASKINKNLSDLDLRNSELTKTQELLNKVKENDIKLTEKQSLKAEWMQKLSEKLDKVKKNNSISEEAYTEAIKTQTVAAEKLNGELEKSVGVTKKAGAGYTSMGSSILKSFGWTAVILGAITAITFAITKLIDFINKIPKDVELKLKLEEDIIKEVQTAEEKIAKIRFDIAQKSSKKDLELIKQKLVEEGIATEKEVRKINDAKGLLAAEFWDTYLKNVKAVAENEYLIRRDIELRLQKELAITRLEAIRKDATYLQGFASIFGAGALAGANKELKKLNKEIKDFENTFYKDGVLQLKPVAFNTYKPKGGGKDVKTIQKELEGVGVSQFTKADMDKYAKDLADRVRASVKAQIETGVGKPIDLKSIFGPTQPGLPLMLFDTTTISDNLQNYFERERDLFENQMSAYVSYVDSLATITDAFVGIYDARLTALDNYYNKESALILNSTRSEEQKSKELERIEIERYNRQRDLFEKQKKWQIASVLLNYFSGLMNIYTSATLPVSMGGTIRPLNWIQAGLETTALTLTSAAQIKNIQSQQLNGGVAPNSSSAQIPSLNSVTPNKIATRSSEEILNAINSEENGAVVKVSEINKIQSRVRVSELNSNY